MGVSYTGKISSLYWFNPLATEAWTLCRLIPRSLQVLGPLHWPLGFKFDRHFVLFPSKLECCQRYEKILCCRGTHKRCCCVMPGKEWQQNVISIEFELGLRAVHQMCSGFSLHYSRTDDLNTTAHPSYVHSVHASLCFLWFGLCLIWPYFSAIHGGSRTIAIALMSVRQLEGQGVNGF